MNTPTKAIITLMLCTLLTMGLLPLSLSLDLSSLASQPSGAADAPSDFSDTTLQQQAASGPEDERMLRERQPPSWDLKLSALFRSLLAGLSTSLGAGVVLLPSTTPTAPHMAFALSLAGGVMVTVSLLELWLPRFLEPGWRFQAIAFSVCGALAFLGLSQLVPEPEYGKYASEVDLEFGSDKDQVEKRQGKQWRLAMLMMLALTAHNFPEGLAVAISSMENERLGFVVMAAIAVHNVPEGIAIAMPVFDATKSRTRAMQMATLSGLAEPLGAIVALTMLPQEMLQGRGMDALLCVVGGIMTSVAMIELFPEARAQGQPRATLAGTLAGVAVMLLTIGLA